MARGDEELMEAMGSSVSAIGDSKFLQWVQGMWGKKMAGMESVEDVSFRKVVEALSAEEVEGKVSEVLGVEAAEFQGEIGVSPRNNTLRKRRTK